MSWILIAVLIVLVAMVVLSYIVEALCPEATRNIGLGPQDSDRVCGSRRHKSPLDTSPTGSSKAVSLPPRLCPMSLHKSSMKSAARLGHYQGFLSLLAHERLWPKARDEYASIKVPVLLVYGDQDWAPPVERERTRSLIPNVKIEIVRNGNHSSHWTVRENCSI